MAYLGRQTHAPTRSEIARAFGIKGAARVDLRRLLESLQEEGSLTRGQGRRYRKAGDLPPVTVIEVTRLDEDGEAIAVPSTWPGPGAPPEITVRQRRGRPAPAVGQRLLARIGRDEAGGYRADPMRIVGPPKREAGAELIGMLRQSGKGFTLSSADRSMRHDFTVATEDRGDAGDGDLVVAEIKPGGRRDRREARVTERIAPAGDPHYLTRIAIRAAGIPDIFPDDVLAQAKSIKSLNKPSGRRVDLRHLPFVTIDGADARDFDDAVCARQSTDGDGGWQVAVAIADVSHYVRPGSALDAEAERRGNSVYFPDMVVPMLPERLSNDLCSLRPDEDRPCLVAHLAIGPRGQLRGHRFERALIRSTARLTYTQVQAARDGARAGKGEPWRRELEALYDAFGALADARFRRGALDLDLPEYRPVVAADGRVERIDNKPRLDSHRLIEEMMIAANVAAAETLERRGASCMFRVHEHPDTERVDDLANLARELKLKPGRGARGSAKWFNGVAAAARDPAERHLISQLTLRAQARAEYAPENIGHFGLGLASYAHFTSPIRRYADLLVHRSLVGLLGLGAGGSDDETGDDRALGTALSAAERRAAAAERDTANRYKAEFLATRRGQHFTGLVSGIAKFGVFVTIDDIGADGLIPMSRLGDERFRVAPTGHAMTGQRTRTVYRLGQPLDIVLAEVDPIAGSLVFDLAGAGRRPDRKTPRGRSRKKRR